ncbi:HNH endonuclease family protein [Mycobacterium xenopi 3993]|nr:HNH endonuclease family protein [Mycobacterium xenopi 3993]
MRGSRLRATRGLHAHHIVHWEDGGATELANLVLVCPYHHRLHHRGVITITGSADKLIVTDSTGRRLRAGSLARPPNRPRRRPTLPRAHRRTRQLVVVPTLPTTTPPTNN